MAAAPVALQQGEFEDAPAAQSSAPVALQANEFEDAPSTSASVVPKNTSLDQFQGQQKADVAAAPVQSTAALNEQPTGFPQGPQSQANQAVEQTSGPGYALKPNAPAPTNIGEQVKSFQAGSKLVPVERNEIENPPTREATNMKEPTPTPTVGQAAEHALYEGAGFGNVERVAKAAYGAGKELVEGGQQALGDIGEPFQPKQTVQGITKIISGGSKVAIALSAPELLDLAGAADGGNIAAQSAIVKLLATAEAGNAASDIGGRMAEKANVTPETQELIRTGLFFLPALVGTTIAKAGVRGGIGVDKAGNPAMGVSSPEGTVRAGVRGTPTAYEANVAVGSSRFGVKVPRPQPVPDAAQIQAGEQQAAATATATKAAVIDKAAADKVAGVPPPPPPPQPAKPTGMDQATLTQKVVSDAAEIIKALPQDKQSGAMLEAHGNLAKWMMNTGRFVGPDGKLQVADTPQKADKLAQDVLNAEIDRQTSAVQEKQKQVEAQAKEQEKQKKEAAKAAETPNENGLTPQEQLGARVKTILEANPKITSHAEQVATVAKHLAIDTPTASKLVTTAVAAQQATVGNGADKTTEESRATVDAQVAALAKGDIHTVMLPEGSKYMPQVPKGAKVVKVTGDVPGAGTYITTLRAATVKEAAKAGTHGDLLGHIETKEDLADNKPQVVVQAKTPDGTVIQDSQVHNHPEMVGRQAEILHERHPEATISVAKPEDVIAERQAAAETAVKDSEPVELQESEFDAAQSPDEDEREFKKQNSTYDQTIGLKGTDLEIPKKSIAGLPDIRDTGWKALDVGDTATAINPTTQSAVIFKGAKGSGTDLLRAKAQRDAFAIDNPIPRGHHVVFDEERGKWVMQGRYGEMQRVRETRAEAIKDAKSANRVHEEPHDVERFEPEPKEVTKSRESEDKLAENRPEQVAEGGEVAAEKPNHPTPEPTERRTDVAHRKEVSSMSEEEMRRELLTSPTVDLPNRRAFDEAQKGKPAAAVAMSDADGLKALNDKFGYEAGDQLLRAKAESLKEAGLDAYHDKGDEFLYRADSEKDLQIKLREARESLRSRIIEVTTKDGKTLRFRGADFSFGVGGNLDAAESGLKGHKSDREAAGERARGELRGISEVGPEKHHVDKGTPSQVATPEPLKQGDPVTFKDRKGTERTGHVIYARDRIVRIKATDGKLVTVPAKNVAKASNEVAKQVVDDFVAAPNGTKDFGEITPEIAKSAGVSAAPIRLREGNDTYGLKHIEARHGEGIRQRGYPSVEVFVEHIAKNFDAVYPRPRGALDLVLSDGDHGRMIVSLEPHGKGDYYDVKTATPSREDQYKNKKPLWERAGTSTTPAEAGPLHPRGQGGESSIAQVAGSLPAGRGARKSKAAKASEEAAAKLAEHFTPGNVIHSNYWKEYDKVLSFTPSTEGKGWSVGVIKSDKEGNPVPGERERTHSTFPDKRDVIVKRAGPKSEGVVLRSSFLGAEKLVEFMADAGVKFYEKDIEPSLKKLGPTAVKAGKQVTDILYPRIGANEDALDSLMKAKGDREAYRVSLENIDKGLDKFFDKMPLEAQIAFMDRAKLGVSQLGKDKEQTQKLDEIRVLMEHLNDESTRRMLEYKPNMALRDHYYGMIWKTIPDATGKHAATNAARAANGFTGQGKRPFEGAKGFMKRSTLENITEGINMGGEPITHNPWKMFRLVEAQKMQYITAQDHWKRLKELGLRKFVRHGEKKPEEWAPLDDRLAKTFFPATSGEGMVHAGDWYLEHSAALLLNNYLSRDLIRENAIGNALMLAKNLSTGLELSLSPFHLMFESLEAMGSQLGLGVQRFWNTGVREGSATEAAKGLGDAAGFMAAPFLIARSGGSMLKMIQSPQDFAHTKRGVAFLKKYPNAPALLGDLYDGGLTWGMNQDYRTDPLKSLRESAKEGNYVGTVLRALPALNQTIMHPLFGVLIPRLKWGLALAQLSQQYAEEAEALSSGDTTREKIARQVVDTVENRLGELNFSNLFWNNTFKSIMQFIFRSVTWKLGNWRGLGSALGPEMKQAFADPLKAMYEDVRGGKKTHQTKDYIPRMGPNQAWLFGMIAMTTMLGTIFAKLVSKKYPWEHAKEDAHAGYTAAGAWLLESIHPRTGKVNKVTGKPERVSLPTGLKDFEHAVHSPKQYVNSSLSSTVGRFTDIAENRDFFGNYVYDPNASYYKKAAEIFSYAVPRPIGLENWNSEFGSQDLESKAMRFAGFNASSSQGLDNSEAEQRMADLAKAGHTPKTPEQVKGYRERNTHEKPTMAQVRATLKHGNREHLEEQFSKLGYADARDLFYNYATPRERALLKPMLDAKRMRLLKKDVKSGTDKVAQADANH